MIDFEFHSPTTLDEALELLDKHGDDARVMSGGTALVMMMKQRLAQPSHVIGLRRVSGLTGISQASNGDVGGVRIGALCTQRQVETDPTVAQVAPLVSYAFSRVATPRIRNMGTIGGGLVHGDPNQDPPPALIALGASAILTSKDGERVVQVEDLFLDYFETDVQPGEILTSVSVPPAPAGSGVRLLEVSAPYRRRLRHRVRRGYSGAGGGQHLPGLEACPGSVGRNAHQGQGSRVHVARAVLDG